jgi:hypothetical protein
MVKEENDHVQLLERTAKPVAYVGLPQRALAGRRWQVSFRLGG